MSKENLIRNLMTFIPFLYKKLSKDLPSPDISQQQLALLYYIKCEDGKLMKYYYEKMMISKSSLTQLADKLIEEGLIERRPDPDDRRVIILGITEKGEEHLLLQKENAKQILSSKLEPLSSDDITRLNEIFEEMKTIFSKLK